jgi:hypothetical protein
MMRSRVPCIVAGAVLALAIGASLAGHVRLALNPLVFNDDVRQHIVPFFRYAQEGVAAPDILSDYQLDITPPGFWLLYRTLAPVVDPEPLSKALPYALFLAMLLGVGIAAHRLGGPVVALVALAVAIQTPVFLSRMTGGLERGFAFPLLALGLCALVAGRVRWLAALVVVAMAFYPPAAAILGIALGALVFIVPRRDRGEAEGWSWRRSLAALFLVGALTSATFVPTALGARSWGRQLESKDVAVYPEFGAEGRSGINGRMPLPGDGGKLLAAPVQKLARDRTTLVMKGLSLLLMLGLIPLAKRDAGARRALALPLAAGAGYVLAVALAPYMYIPQRYLAYAVPLLVTVLLPASGAALAGIVSPPRWARHAATIGAVFAGGAALLLLGGRGGPGTGYTVKLDGDARIYKFIRGLPKDALVAGWPRGVIDNVPYACRRRAFVTYETHQVFHEGYVLEMRRRMHALIAALFSDDPRGLMELRDTFGVTHLIVDAEDFSKPPRYFAPFDTEVKRTWQRGVERGFAIESLLTKATVFREGKLTVLDLSRL